MTEEIKNLKKQRDAINQQIAKLEAAELQNATTFEERLKVWYESDNGIKLDWVPSKGEYPHLREYLNEHDLDRYREYDLREWFEDDIICIQEGNLDLIGELNLNAIKECVEKNVHSFTFDW